MRLYHATSLDNKDNILLCGLHPGYRSSFDRWIDADGIYGFTKLEDALGFARDQCWDGIAVFSFDVNDEYLIPDPEYDDPLYGVAYFYRTDESMNAKLEFET